MRNKEKEKENLIIEFLFKRKISSLDDIIINCFKYSARPKPEALIVLKKLIAEKKIVSENDFYKLPVIETPKSPQQCLF